MKKLFASVLAVSLAITGIHTTAYAADEATTVSVEEQKSNPYMSEIDKELKDFFAKYNAETNSEKKDELLDTAINEVQSKIDSHAHFLNVMEDGVQKRDVENKSAALKLKHSILSTVKAKEQEKRSALKEKDSELRAKEREAQTALDKKEEENNLKIEKLKEQAEDKARSRFLDGAICGEVIMVLAFVFEKILWP